MRLAPRGGELRVALVHDWLTGMRGGEKVLLSLARMFPDAPVYTLLHVPLSVDPEIEARQIHTTFLQHLPGIARSYRSYLPLFPAAAATLRLDAYDLVISSSHCVVKSVRTRPDATHVCYCHTPMRYVWDRYDDYFGSGRAAWPVRATMALVAPWLRRWDRRTAHRPNLYVANSHFVAAAHSRVLRTRGARGPATRGRGLLHSGRRRPRVATISLSRRWCHTSESTWFSTPTAVRVFLCASSDRARRRARLRAVGSARRSHFLGPVVDAELRDLYRDCRLVLLPGVEDFGIVPLEAMACGRPAIAFAEGGGLETVLPGKTGLLFDSPTADALRRIGRFLRSDGL